MKEFKYSAEYLFDDGVRNSFGSFEKTLGEAFDREMKYSMISRNRRIIFLDIEKDKE